MNEAAVLAKTEAWVRNFVIALDLCPFAERVVSLGGLRLRVSRATIREALVTDLASELRRLADDEGARDSTTLLILPEVLHDFDAFNQFLGLADELLQAEKLVGRVQIASFHPDYRFADTPADAPENYTNRSPYPMLHLLLESDVSRAVDQHPDPGRIPARNVARLRELGVSAIRERLRGCGAVRELEDADGQ